DGPHSYQPQTIRRIQQWFDQYVAMDYVDKGRRTDIRVTCEHDDRTTTIFNGMAPTDNKLSLLPELLTGLGQVELPKSIDDWPAIQRHALERINNESLMLVHGEVAGSGH